MPQPLEPLVSLMRAFLAGATSLEQASKITGAFAACGFDDDETYADLQYALAMYQGPGNHESLSMLRSECGWAVGRLTTDSV